MCGQGMVFNTTTSMATSTSNISSIMSSTTPTPRDVGGHGRPGEGKERESCLHLGCLAWTLSDSGW